MVTDIILHIGMYHTGTTSLQNVLSKNPPELLQKGIFFYTAVPLTYALHQECNPKAASIYGSISADRLFSEIIQRVNELGMRTLVLSHEGIVYNPYYRNLTHNLGNSLKECAVIARHIRQRLYELTKPYRVRIVFYPRRQDHWIVANYCNAINKNDLFGIQFEDIFSVASDCLRYATLMEQWAKLFGRDAICVRPYEKEQMPHGTLEDFCTHVLHCATPDKEKDVRANTTPGAMCISVLRGLNRCLEEDYLNTYIREWGASLQEKDSPILMDYKQRLKILQFFAAENARLARSYMGRDDGRLFLEGAPSEKNYPLLETTNFSQRIEGACQDVQRFLETKHIALDPQLLPFTVAQSVELPKQNRRTELHLALGREAQSPDLLLRIPQGFFAERSYAARILLTELLGYNVFVQQEDRADYALSLLDGTPLLRFADAFFGSLAEEQWPYQMPQPSAAFPLETPCQKFSLLSFYGSPQWEHNTEGLFCGADVFATTFLLTSRIGDLFAPKDSFGRPLPTAQTSSLHRPILHEWGAWLRAFFKEHQLPDYYPHTFSLYMTHDIDHIEEKAENIFWLARQNYIHGLSATFNFMSYSSHPKYDDGYIGKQQEETAAIMRRLQQKFQQRLGFHPGFLSRVDRILWRAQKNLLEEVVGAPLVEGRQHYLKYSYPFTWRIFEENHMALDTGLCYAQEAGFTAGTGIPFTAFDFLRRAPLQLRVLPLLFMDARLTFFQGTVEQFFAELCSLIDVCRQYAMPCCLLFHNTFFTGTLEAQKKAYYTNILKQYM